MLFPRLMQFGVACGFVTILAGDAFAFPPGRVGPPLLVRPAPLPLRPLPPLYGGPRIGIVIGIGNGYGSGLYGPLSYGLGYSPFGYSGLDYGGLGYGPLGYGYGYPGRYSSGSLGVPVIPGTYSAPYQTMPVPTPNPQLPQPRVNPEPEPLPLPAPTPETTVQGNAATITVLANDGATVTFDGVASNQTGTRHTFTTKPIPAGAQIRVQVKVDGPGGPSTISVGMRSGEKATVDMRK